MAQNKWMCSSHSSLTAVCFLLWSKCLLMLLLSLCLEVICCVIVPLTTELWLVPLWCNGWCDYWNLFIALPVDKASILTLHSNSLCIFHFLFAWQPFVWAHCRGLVLDGLPVDPLNRRLVQEALFFPPQCYLFDGPFLPLHFSLFPPFLSDLLISLRSGSFSSFGWMTSLVQWARPGLPPLPHSTPVSPGNAPQRPPCYKIAFRINWNDLLLSVCLELIGKSWSFVRK